MRPHRPRPRRSSPQPRHGIRADGAALTTRQHRWAPVRQPPGAGNQERVMRNFGLLLLGSAICALGHAAPAWAQANPGGSAGPEALAISGAQTDSDTFGAIVVTAQRREENLQDVPIAATA